MGERFDGRWWGRWTAGFLAFPIAGLVGGAIAGPVDGPLPAALGGLATGAVIGVGQWLASDRLVELRTWAPATAAGMGAGLLAGAALAGYRTDLGALALQGLATGVPLGIAQAIALRGRARTPWVWALAVPPLWSLGWVVTTSAGVGVDARFTVFGATGALAFSALSGLVMERLRVRRTAAAPRGN